jgi:hypothetical protein
MLIRLALAATLLACQPAMAQQMAATEEPGSPGCAPSIATTEQNFRLPAKLLGTIALVESGRPDPQTGRTTPWPWTINVAGTGQYFASKAAAIIAVEQLQSSGVRSIDVGCMQINLMYHPNAFANLDQAFDPPTNIFYGGRFLAALYHQIGNWPLAAAAYHSQTPAFALDYESRVMSLWPLAAKFPDPSLAMRINQAAGAIDTSVFTPAFAASIKAMHAETAALLRQHGSLPSASFRPASLADRYGAFTPEFAASLKQLQADFARLGAAPPRS